MRAAVLLLPCLACVTSTYAQHQAAFVPRATPLPTDGQPLQGAGELALGASNIHELARPTAGDPNTGVEVPGTQLRGALALRPSTNTSLYVVYERGLASTTIPVQTSDPKIDGGDTIGYGVGWSVSIPTSTPGLHVAIANEVVVWSTPWIQYTSCVQNCTVPGATSISTGSSNVAVFAVAIVPSYRTGRFTVFGGATVRNHPNIADKVVTDFPTDPDVNNGPANMLFHAGAAVEIGAGIRASLILHQEVTFSPVHYGPGLAAMLAIPFGRDRR